MQWYVGSDARESFLSGLFQSVYTKRNVLISRTDVKQRQNVPWRLHTISERPQIHDTGSTLFRNLYDFANIRQLAHALLHTKLSD